MGYSLAIGPTQVQFPQSRAVVTQTTRHSPRVEEILGTARVIRQDEHAAKPQSRASRRDGGDLTSDNPDPDKALSDGPNAWPLGQIESLLITLKELDAVSKRY